MDWPGLFVWRVWPAPQGCTRSLICKWGDEVLSACISFQAEGWPGALPHSFATRESLAEGEFGWVPALFLSPSGRWLRVFWKQDEFLFPRSVPEVEWDCQQTQPWRLWTAAKTKPGMGKGSGTPSAFSSDFRGISCLQEAWIWNAKYLCGTHSSLQPSSADVPNTTWEGEGLPDFPEDSVCFTGFY